MGAKGGFEEKDDGWFMYLADIPSFMEETLLRHPNIQQAILFLKQG